MSDNKQQCDLCGLEVEVDGFQLKTIDGEKRFCCEGCKGIYQMLHEDQVVSENLDSTTNQ